MLQSYVDRQIGSVLGVLAARPAVAANTVIVFTSDHGEYGGAHGLRGKGAGAYEEAIRVPLYVCDPRSVVTRAEGLEREALTSSVDVVALLLSIATGSESWRNDGAYAHLATRADLAAICSDPLAPGRDWILHATDEDVTEFAIEPYAADAPRHVVALRTPGAKLGVYSDWQAGGIEVQPEGLEAELYDYASPGGQAELENLAGQSELEDELYATLTEQAIPGELRAELPAALRQAGERGLSDYLSVEEYETEKAAYDHLRQQIEPEEPAG
jgi:arylsulfatase A-like enzyme